jgi:hypothetical protein
MVKDKIPNDIKHICNYIIYNFNLQPYYIIDDYFNQQTSPKKSSPKNQISLVDTLGLKIKTMSYKKPKDNRRFRKKSMKKKRARLKVMPHKKKPKGNKRNYER